MFKGLRNLSGLMVLALLLFLQSGWAAKNPNLHADLSAYASKEKVEKGEQLVILVKMEFEKHWHVYSLNEQLSPEGIGPTTTELVPKDEYFEFDKTKIQAPKPKVHYDAGFEMDIEYYDGTVEFKIPVTAKKAIDFTMESPTVEAYMQQCDTSKCLPPEAFNINIETGDYSKTGEETVAVSNSARQDESQKFDMKANPSKLSVKKDEEFSIFVTLNFDEHWYTYSTKEQLSPEGIGPTMTEIVPDAEAVEFDAKNLKAPKPKTKMDKGFEMDIDYHKGKVVFELPVKAKKDLNFAQDEVKVEVYLQQCDTSKCLPPTSYFTPVQNEMYIAEADEDDIHAAGTQFGSEVEQVKKKGVFSFLWFAMANGAIALLTPCVFPMIPITVSFFTKRAEKEGGKGLRDSLVYTLGIITTFTALGFILALIFGATGIQDFATNPWINMFIAAIFIIFALNLFGAFEIQVPTGLMNKLNQKSQSGGGITSVLLMGLTFSLTSFTCTVPFVGTALASASGGEWFYPIIGMLGFSGVFAAPFFLLALFPSAMNKMPKAGGWMNNVKVVMGFLEIAASIKFLSNADLVWRWGIIPREIFLAIWIACTVLIVLYTLGIFRLSHDSPVDSIGTPRILFAIFFTTITFYLAVGLIGKPLGELDAFLPPPDYEMLMSDGDEAVVSAAAVGAVSKSNGGHEELFWYSDYEPALEAAKKENKPLFIDFTGITCTNCRWMELNMFPRNNVKSRLEQMVRVRIYTDRKTPKSDAYKKMQLERFNTIAQPLYVIQTIDEKTLGTREFTRDEQEFVKFLQDGIDDFHK